MNVYLAPRTKEGKYSLILIAAMPILFYIGTSFTNSLYKSGPAGKTILEDISTRPVLALTMISGMAAGISAFAVGIISIIKQRERALLTYISTVIGFMLLLFLSGEIISPH